MKDMISVCYIQGGISYLLPLRCRRREAVGGSLCFGDEQEGLNVPNPCVDEHCPLFNITKAVGLDCHNNSMIAVRGINPKILENAALPDRFRLRSVYSEHEGCSIIIEDLNPLNQFTSRFLSSAVSLHLMPAQQIFVHLGHIHTKCGKFVIYIVVHLISLGFGLFVRQKQFEADIL